MILKRPINSAGTEGKSIAEIIDSRIFFAPLSAQTCNVFAKSSTFIAVPLIVMSPKTASELAVACLLSYHASIAYPGITVSDHCGQEAFTAIRDKSDAETQYLKAKS